MVELMDLSSTIQLACGINFAGAVLMERHERFIAANAEQVSYARGVVLPRIEENQSLTHLERQKSKEEVELCAARVENTIFEARFGPGRFPMPRRIRRLQYLCFLAGAASTVALSVPAFVQSFELSWQGAICLLAGMFAPVPLALLDIHRCALERAPIIRAAKEKLANAMSVALAS